MLLSELDEQIRLTEESINGNPSDNDLKLILKNQIIILDTLKKLVETDTKTEFTPK